MMRKSVSHPYFSPAAYAELFLGRVPVAPGNTVPFSPEQLRFSDEFAQGLVHPGLCQLWWLGSSPHESGLHCICLTLQKTVLAWKLCNLPLNVTFCSRLNVSLIWTSLTQVIYTDNQELQLLQSLEWYLHSPCSSETGFKASIISFFCEVSLIDIQIFKCVHTSLHFLVYYYGDR